MRADDAFDVTGRVDAETIQAIMRCIVVAISDDRDALVLLEHTSPVKVLRITTFKDATMRRLKGRGGETIRALERVLAAMAWRTPFTIRLALDGPAKHNAFEVTGGAEHGQR